MTLRGTAAHLRRCPSWRRSGDESYWEGMLPEGEVRPRRGPRPHSMADGGQMDNWLQQHEETQRGHFRDLSTLTLGSTQPALRHQGTPSFYSRDHYSCGSPSLYESSVGSHESLLAGCSTTPVLRGSLERARIMQVPAKEQAKLSSLAPVRICWLPIQRKVTVTEARCQNQRQEHSGSQVKLKQPITPIIQKDPVNVKGLRRLEGESEDRDSRPNGLRVQTWQTPDPPNSGSAGPYEQVSNKTNSAPKQRGGSLTWQSLRRGWPINKTSAHRGGSPSNHLSSNDTAKTHLTRTSSLEPYKVHTPPWKSTSIQPVRSSSPTVTTHGLSQPSLQETSSSVTTLVPQNKAGFSSISISSKKVIRSTSPQHSMEPTPNTVSWQRKATILKVTEQRVTSTPSPCTNVSQRWSCNPRGDCVSDTAAHGTKATVIKVTEHRESYRPLQTGDGTRHQEYRHGYTEGLHEENSEWLQGSHGPPEHGSSGAGRQLEPCRSDSLGLGELKKSDGALHRSTLSLLLNNPSEPSSQFIRETSSLPRRPASCYGSVENEPRPSSAEKLSFGLPLETDDNRRAPDWGFLSGRTQTGRQVATPEPTVDRKGSAAPRQETARRPSLTLIKTPDPNSQQSAQEILALNAAAIIANIKLQRQLSKTKPQDDISRKNSVASPQGNKETHNGKEDKSNPGQAPVQHASLNMDHGFLPPSTESNTTKSEQTISLQEALERSRPGFISRSRNRVMALRQRAEERRTLADSDTTGLWSGATLRQKRGHPSPQSDNLFKPRDGDMHHRAKRSLGVQPQLKRNPKEETKREVCLTNRQRMGLFKKRLLDQILQRSNI